jgi:protein-tyrosine phosphatase
MQKLKQILRSYLSDKWWDLKCKDTRNPPLPQKPQSFLFICKGNLCRSPFAEHLAMAKFNNYDFLFSSAGLQVIHSNPPPKEACQAALSFGVDISAHVSREVDSNAISSSDMILTMEYKHLCELQGRFPAYKDKIFLLPLFDTTESNGISGYARCNIFDPFGKNAQVFKNCFKRIEQCLNQMFYNELKVLI